MAIDLKNLSQTDLLQLVNATPPGAVLTRSRLRRQMDAAAVRGSVMAQGDVAEL